MKVQNFIFIKTLVASNFRHCPSINILQYSTFVVGKASICRLSWNKGLHRRATLILHDSGREGFTVHKDL
jgi:hypothetical protein